MLRTYVVFWLRMIQYTFRGGAKFYAWIGFLGALVVSGILAYLQQFQEGMIVTNLTDQVSWGAYIANFTFLVGVAAAAVLLVVPAYVYHHEPTKEVVLLGELLAISAIIMCLSFVMVDVGRPDRLLHIVPFLGRMNFPQSVLAWDVIVLNVYLLLNLHIPGYLLFKKYLNQKPNKIYYLPFVFISILWAVSIHTVTAFLYSGLGGRPYWNSAILAPRFLVSAFVSGPAILILVFGAVNRFTQFKVRDQVFRLLRIIMFISLGVNLFLLSCELFKEFYTDSLHLASARYLFFGLHEYRMLVPYIWSAMTMEILALVLLSIPKFRRNKWALRGIAIMVILGIWVEKGMGLIIPGFVPSPLGDIVEYTPSLVEFFVCLGIWSLGALTFTLMSKVAIGIETGALRVDSAVKRVEQPVAVQPALS